MLLWRLFLLKELKPTAVQGPSCSRDTETLKNVKKPLRSLPLHTAVWNGSFASSRARCCQLAAAAAGTRLREAQGTGGQGGQHAAEPLCGGRSLASAISAARSSGRTTSCFLIVREQPLISRDNIFLPAPAAARPWAGEAISPRWRDVFQTQPCCLSALHFAYPLLGTTNQKKSPSGLEAKPPPGTQPSRRQLQWEEVLLKSQGLPHAQSSPPGCCVYQCGGGVFALTPLEQQL